MERAVELSEKLVGPLGRRWDHTRAVAARAGELAPAVAPEDHSVLIASAWLHDIGYCPAICHTRFHPLDGARYLQREGWPAIIVNLVANHSAARFEAVERGLMKDLVAFPFELTALQDALDTADLTTGPDGQRMTFDERIDEILVRYPTGDPVHQFWLTARPVEAEAIGRTEWRLAAT